MAIFQFVVWFWKTIQYGVGRWYIVWSSLKVDALIKKKQVLNFSNIKNNYVGVEFNELYNKFFSLEGNLFTKYFKIYFSLKPEMFIKDISNAN